MSRGSRGGGDDGPDGPATRPRSGHRLSELETARRSLRDTELKFQTLYNRAPVILHSIGVDGKILSVSERWLSTFGYEREEVVGRLSTDFLTEESRRYASDVILPRFFETGEVLDVPYTWVKKSGELVDVLLSATAERDEDGNFVRSLAVLVDVTETRRAEEVRRRSEERLRAFVLALPDSAIIVDAGGTVTDILSRPSGGFAAGQDQLIGTRFDELMPAKVAARCREAVRRTLETDVTQVCDYSLSIDDEERFYDARASVVHGLGDDEPDQVVWLARDITERTEAYRALLAKEKERRHLAEQLRHAQKMEAIGTLAGGVAHDFNNLLTGILGHASLLRLRHPIGTPTRQTADVIEQAALRAESLTKQLLGFARRGKQQDAAVDAHAVVDEVMSLLRRTVDRRITIVTDLQAPTPWVQGDPDQVQQVMMNLAVNARDAMPDGGTLTVATAVERPPAGGRYCVLLSVEDTGEGIPADIQDRIFEPFFTTKRSERGTGMGLATVYGIVKNHRGELRFESEVGRGTRFDVWLPLAESQPTSPVLRVHDEPVRGVGNVLVVDDEALVREVAEALLTELGYAVTSVPDGAAALSAYQRAETPFDLVLLDMTMPVMSGAECFTALLRMDPKARVVLATGHSAEGTAQALLDNGLAGFIQKPYTLAELGQVIQAALAR